MTATTQDAPAPTTDPDVISTRTALAEVQPSPSSPRPRWRPETVGFWRRQRRLQRSLAPLTPEAVPNGSTVVLPGRGETFVRHLAGPPGARTVLLLHGWLATADTNWLGTFDALTDRYHVLAIDHRGHGRGMRSLERFRLEDCADDAAALLDVLKVRSAIVAGFSMGGPIGLLMARRHPERVAGLVPCATAAEMARTGIQRGMPMILPLIRPLMQSRVAEVGMAAVARRPPAALGSMGDLAPWLAAETLRSSGTAARQAGRELTRFDARDWAHELGVPAASVITTRDRAVSVRKQEWLATALDAQRVHLDADHVVMMDDPLALGGAVRHAIDLVEEQLSARTRFGWGRFRMVDTAA